MSDVEFDPSTFVSTMHCSTHFEFVRPETKEVDRLRATLTELMARYPPAGVIDWLELQLADAERQMASAQKIADEKNGRELAKRVIHKFRKWGRVRFGLADNCKRDFYDGSARVDSDTQRVVLEPSFENAVFEQALAEGVDANDVVNHLHVGVSSLKRFGKWMAVAQPVETQVTSSV